MKNLTPMKNSPGVGGGGRGMQGKLSWPPDKYYTGKLDET